MGLNDVWVLHVDMEHGKGKWECLIRNQSVVDDDDDNDDDGVVRPPGRNAATLCAINAGKLLPNMKAGTEGDDGKGSCFLLQVSAFICLSLLFCICVNAFFLNSFLMKLLVILTNFGLNVCIFGWIQLYRHKGWMVSISEDV